MTPDKWKMLVKKFYGEETVKNAGNFLDSMTYHYLTELDIAQFYKEQGILFYEDTLKHYNRNYFIKP